MWQLWPQCQFSPVFLGSKLLHSLHRTFRTLLHVREMRALAALAALHVILACPAGECDGVEMLQGSMSHRQESAAIQLSAMVHDGKHNKPEAKHGRKHRKPEAKHGRKHKQSAVSAPSPPSPTEKEIEEKKNWYKMSFGWHSDGDTHRWW